MKEGSVEGVSKARVHYAYKKAGYPDSLFLVSVAQNIKKEKIPLVERHLIAGRKQTPQNCGYPLRAPAITPDKKGRPAHRRAGCFLCTSRIFLACQTDMCKTLILNAPEMSIANPSVSSFLRM